MSIIITTYLYNLIIHHFENYYKSYNDCYTVKIKNVFLLIFNKFVSLRNVLGKLNDLFLSNIVIFSANNQLCIKKRK